MGVPLPENLNQIENKQTNKQVFSSLLPQQLACSCRYRTRVIKDCECEAKTPAHITWRMQQGRQQAHKRVCSYSFTQNSYYFCSYSFTQNSYYFCRYVLKHLTDGRFCDCVPKELQQLKHLESKTLTWTEETRELSS